MGVIMPVTDHVKLCTATHSSIRLLMCKGTRGRGNYALFQKRMIMTGLGCCILANNAEMRLKLPWCRLQAFCFKGLSCIRLCGTICGTGMLFSSLADSQHRTCSSYRTLCQIQDHIS